MWLITRKREREKDKNGDSRTVAAEEGIKTLTQNGILRRGYAGKTCKHEIEAADRGDGVKAGANQRNMRMDIV